MALSDEEIEQVNKNIDDKLESGEKHQSIKSLSTTAKFVLAGALSFFVWMIFSQNLTNVQKGGLLVMLAAGVLFFTSYNTQDKKMLTEQELSARAYQQMKYKQDHHLGSYYQVPKGDIIIGMVGGRKIVDGKILYYERRIQVKPRYRKGILEYAMKQDPYTGDATAFIEKKEGYSGEEVDQPAITLFSKGLRDDLRVDRVKQSYRKQ